MGSALAPLNMLPSIQLNLSTGHWNLLYAINEFDQYHPVMATYSVWHNQYHTSSTPPSPRLIIFRIQYRLQPSLPNDSEKKREVMQRCGGPLFPPPPTAITVDKQLDGSQGNCLESWHRLCIICWQNCQWVNDHGQLAESPRFNSALPPFVLAQAAVPFLPFMGAKTPTKKQVRITESGDTFIWCVNSPPMKSVQFGDSISSFSDSMKQHFTMDKSQNREWLQPENNWRKRYTTKEHNRWWSRSHGC